MIPSVILTTGRVLIVVMKKAARDAGVLYYGDNLGVLQEYVDDESVDLVYLDPPFNSSAQYNVIFERGDGSGAQAAAFLDSWTWTDESEHAYESVMKRGGLIADTLSGMKSFLGKNDTLAYLCMMAPRLVELKRVLKPTGSLYLHCDPTASHYLKILLDGVFGPEGYINEIIWRRSFAHNDPRRCGRIHDTILLYAKSKERVWNRVLQKPSPEYVEMFFDQYDPKRKERYARHPLDAPRHGNGGNLVYEWKGRWPTPKRTWSCTIQKMMEYEKAGRIHYPKDGMPRLKRYESEYEGTAIQDIWTDINKIHNQSAELLGYPTQKPLALLERIIAASSNPGDVVLDPFCGCGTAVDAAQKLGRQWIGIDVTHYAITVIEGRLKKQFNGLIPQVVGRPEDIAGAWDLAHRDKFQFQWWANWLVGVQNYREQKAGADQGIDGKIFFMNGPYGTGRIIVSVKGGDTVNPSMIRDLIGTVDSEEAQLGLFVCIAEPSQGMVTSAARAGTVKTAHGMFPKVQIATIEELLAGKRANLPPYYEVDGARKIGGKKRSSPGAEPQLSFKFPITGGGKRKQKDEEIIYPAASLLLAR